MARSPILWTRTWRVLKARGRSSAAWAATWSAAPASIGLPSGAGYNPYLTLVRVTFAGLEVAYTAPGSVQVTFFGVEVAMSIAGPPIPVHPRPPAPAVMARNLWRWRARRLAPVSLPLPPPRIQSRRPIFPHWVFRAPPAIQRRRPVVPIPPLPPQQRFSRPAPHWIRRERQAIVRRRAAAPFIPVPRPFRRPWIGFLFTAAVWMPPSRPRGLTGRHLGFSDLRVPVFAAEPLAGGTPNLRAPVFAAEPLTGGAAHLRVAVDVAEPLTGGEPDLRTAVAVAEPLTGGQPKLRVALVGVEVLMALPPEPFMTIPVFPTLRGRSWSTVKKPTFSTRTDVQQSGKEVRSANYPYPRWEFDLTYQYLPDPIQPSPLASDLRTLAGFFLGRQGSFASFLFQDVTDYQVRQGPIATSDGVTAQWAAFRDFGGFMEPVGQVDYSTIAAFLPAAVTTATSEITVPNHGLATGQEPLYVTSTGALPGGLAATTPYWPIVIDPNTLRLARNLGAALAGTYITLSTQGTGSLSLTKGFSLTYTVTETHSVPATGPYTVTVSNGAAFSIDDGVIIGGVALTAVSGSPGAGQYSVNAATGVYTFNAVQASASAVITYGYLPAASAYTVVMPNQITFSPAPASGVIITADFDFYFVCRFLDDVQEYENFASTLWNLAKCQFVAIPQ